MLTVLVRLRIETLKIITLLAFNCLKEVMGGPLGVHIVKKPPPTKYVIVPHLNPIDPTPSDNVNNVEFAFPCEDHDDASAEDQFHNSYISLIYCVTASTLKVKVNFIT